MEQSEADCRDVLSRIYLYLDGEIADGGGVGIEAHLIECGACMRHADFERAIKELVKRSCGGNECPSTLVERLRGLIRESD